MREDYSTSKYDAPMTGYLYEEVLGDSAGFVSSYGCTTEALAIAEFAELAASDYFADDEEEADDA